MESKLISFIGAPCSGKSTLATDVHTELKKLGKNSIFVQESATDYIAEYGIPNTPIDQLTIFYKQSNRENMFIGSKEFIVCDSSGILNYFYFRRLFGNPIKTLQQLIIFKKKSSNLFLNGNTYSMFHRYQQIQMMVSDIIMKMILRN